MKFIERISDAGAGGFQKKLLEDVQKEPATKKIDPTKQPLGFL